MAEQRTSGRAWWAVAILVVGYLFLFVQAGVTHSPLVPPFPQGAEPPAGWGVAAEFVGLDALDRTTLTFLALSTLLALVGAFVLLVREALRRGLSSRVALGAVVLSLAFASAGPLVLSRDVYSYAVYGRIHAVEGSNPYSANPSAFPGDPFASVLSREWREEPSVYGPAFTLMSAGVVGATRDSPGATVFAFKLLAALAIGGAAWLTALAARRFRPEREAAAFVLVGLNPVLVVQTVGGGHNDALVAAAVAGALVLALPSGPLPVPRRVGDSVVVQLTELPSHSRPGAFGVTALLALATLIKVVAGIPLLLWLWSIARTRRGREGLHIGQLALHTSVAAALALLLTIPWFGLRAVTSMFSLASRRGFASGARLVARGAERLGEALGGVAFADVLTALVYVAFFVLVAIGILGVLRFGGRAGEPEVWGTGLLLLALGAPYLLPWYSAWFAPLLALARPNWRLWIAAGASAVLAIAGVPAEPATQPELWRGMLLGVHYVAAPAMLALFLFAVRRSLDGPEDVPTVE